MRPGRHPGLGCARNHTTGNRRLERDRGGAWQPLRQQQGLRLRASAQELFVGLTERLGVRLMAFAEQPQLRLPQLERAGVGRRGNAIASKFATARLHP